MGVKLVFVTEGEAPKVKADTMNKRNQMRHGASKKLAPARPGRSYFKSVLKEVSVHKPLCVPLDPLHSQSISLI